MIVLDGYFCIFPPDKISNKRSDGSGDCSDKAKKYREQNNPKYTRLVHIPFITDKYISNKQKIAKQSTFYHSIFVAGAGIAYNKCEYCPWNHVKPSNKKIIRKNSKKDCQKNNYNFRYPHHRLSAIKILGACANNDCLVSHT